MLILIKISCFSKNSRMDNGVSESIQNITTVALPGINTWLNKYLIKVRDANTILLYPRDGIMNTTMTNIHDENVNITKEATDDQGEKDTDADNEIADTIAEKHRHVLLLKKLLEQRLRKRLKEDQEFKPSPEINEVV